MRTWFYVSFSLVAAATYGWSLWNGPGFRRPLNGDEVISLRDYTWVGLDPSGGPRRLRRIGDLDSLTKPGARQILMGLYCSLGRWTEPNNHVVNSTLMNFGIAFGPRGEAGVRLPALLGALALAGSFAWLCWMFLEHPGVAPLSILWVLWCPYVAAYSQEARGYTWMLTLQVTSLMIVGRLAKRPASIAMGSAAAVVAALSFMNVVSQAVDWLVPLYATLLFWPSGIDDGERAIWRKSIIAQVLAVGAVGFVFLMDRLPYVYSSLEQYGIEAHGLPDRVAHLYRVIQYLFPTPAWKVFAACGLVGLALPVAGRARIVSKLAVAVFAVGLIHLFMARRMPYERVYGYLLPFFLFGVAKLSNTVLSAMRSARTLGIAWVVILALTLPLAWSPAPTGLTAADFAALSKVAPERDRPAYCLVEPDTNKEGITLYLPQDWGDLSGVPPTPGPVELIVFCRGESVATEPAGAAPWSPSAWSGSSPRVVAGAYRVFAIKGVFSRLSEARPDGDRALFLWYPDPGSVAVFPRPALEIMERYPLRFVTQLVRHQVKLDVFGRLGDVITIVNSIDDYKIATTAAKEGVARCGGTVLIFTPESHGRRIDPTAP